MTPWCIPIARMNVVGTKMVLVRVLSPQSKQGVEWEWGILKEVHSLRRDDDKEGDTILFALVVDDASALETLQSKAVLLTFELLTLQSKTQMHVRSINTRWSLCPSDTPIRHGEGAGLRGVILWMLSDLFGLDVFEPFQVALTPKQVLHLPKVISQDTMAELEQIDQLFAKQQARWNQSAWEMKNAACLLALKTLFPAMKEHLVITAFDKDDPIDEECPTRKSAVDLGGRSLCGRSWKLFLGGPWQISIEFRAVLMCEDSIEIAGIWLVGPSLTGETPFGFGPTPVAALRRARMLITEEELPGWFDEVLPTEIEMLIPDDQLLPYEYLDAVCPLAWDTKRVTDWAKEAGLI